MNDFSKMELQYLLIAIRYMRERTTNCSDMMRKLDRRIQKMADEYCEHEPGMAHFEQFVWQICSKCGVQYK